MSGIFKITLFTDCKLATGSCKQHKLPLQIKAWNSCFHCSLLNYNWPSKVKHTCLYDAKVRLLSTSTSATLSVDSFVCFAYWPQNSHTLLVIQSMLSCYAIATRTRYNGFVVIITAVDEIISTKNYSCWLKTIGHASKVPNFCMRIAYQTNNPFENPGHSDNINPLVMQSYSLSSSLCCYWAGRGED